MTEPRITALRTILQVFDVWQLSAQDSAILLGVDDSLYRQWIENPDRAIVQGRTLVRLHCLTRIANALNMIYSHRQVTGTWLWRGNSHALFRDQSPLWYMLSGGMEELSDVCKHLEARIQVVN